MTEIQKRTAEKLETIARWLNKECTDINNGRSTDQIAEGVGLSRRTAYRLVESSYAAGFGISVAKRPSYPKSFYHDLETQVVFMKAKILTEAAAPAVAIPSSVFTRFDNDVVNARLETVIKRAARFTQEQPKAITVLSSDDVSLKDRLDAFSQYITDEKFAAAGTIALALAIKMFELDHVQREENLAKLSELTRKAL